MSENTRTEAEREALAAVVWPPHYDDPSLDDVVDVVERILADRLAAVQAERDDLMADWTADVARAAKVIRERDDLRGRLAAAEALADEWAECGDGWTDAARFLRAALANPSAAQGEGEAGVLTDAERADLNDRLSRDGFYAPRVRSRILDAFDDALRARADSRATPAPEADQ